MVNVRFSPGHMSSTTITLTKHLGEEHLQLTALVPTLDDLTLANVEAQRLASVVTGIKLLATILEGTAVVNLNLVACVAYLVRILLNPMMLMTILLTNLGLAGTFNGRVDLDVERLVQSRSCCGEECQCAGQSNKLHFDLLYLTVVMCKGRVAVFRKLETWTLGDGGTAAGITLCEMHSLLCTL
jgi:hypothetical protein